jgi:hypothetical protein
MASWVERNTGLNQSTNYITIHPKTRHLSSTGHILLAATDGGIFRTENGGRQWEQVILPDPSNAEFGDVPAATVDELIFDWIDYDPSDTDIIYCRGLKTSLSRMWIYKSTDSGDSWTSRGVVAT